MLSRFTPLPAAAAVLTLLGAAPAAAQATGMAYGADWTGPYAGVQFGRSIADMSGGDDGTGSAIGLQGGYRYDFGTFVLGGEVQYDWLDLDVGDGAGSVDSYGRIKVDLGYGIDQWLFYGTFGATHADAELDGETYDEWGWLAGFGVDYMVSEPIAVGIEVQHHGFGKLGDTDRDFDGTTVEAGVTFRF